MRIKALRISNNASNCGVKQQYRILSLFAPVYFKGNVRTAQEILQIVLQIVTNLIIPRMFSLKHLLIWSNWKYSAIRSAHPKSPTTVIEPNMKWIG